MDIMRRAEPNSISKNTNRHTDMRIESPVPRGTGMNPVSAPSTPLKSCKSATPLRISRRSEKSSSPKLTRNCSSSRSPVKKSSRGADVSAYDEPNDLCRPSMFGLPPVKSSSPFGSDVVLGNAENAVPGNISPKKKKDQPSPSPKKLVFDDLPAIPDDLTFID